MSTFVKEVLVLHGQQISAVKLGCCVFKSPQDGSRRSATVFASWLLSVFQHSDLFALCCHFLSTKQGKTPDRRLNSVLCVFSALSPGLSNGPNANLLTIPKQRSSSVTLTYHAGPRRAGET